MVSECGGFSCDIYTKLEVRSAFKVSYLFSVENKRVSARNVFKDSPCRAEVARDCAVTGFRAIFQLNWKSGLEKPGEGAGDQPPPGRITANFWRDRGDLIYC